MEVSLTIPVPWVLWASMCLLSYKGTSHLHNCRVTTLLPYFVPDGRTFQESLFPYTFYQPSLCLEVNFSEAWGLAWKPSYTKMPRWNAWVSAIASKKVLILVLKIKDNAQINNINIFQWKGKVKQLAQYSSTSSKYVALQVNEINAKLLEWSDTRKTQQ